MKRDDLIILFIALLLLAGMLITILFGGERSRHGVSLFFKEEPRLRTYLAGNYLGDNEINMNYNHFFFLNNQI